MGAEAAKEGWYADPAGRHAYRWFSAGEPTSLVKDGGRTAKDDISIHDAELFRSMNLAQEPDDGPLLHSVSNARPHFEIINLGAGPVAVVNTAADRPYRQPRFGAATTLVAWVPLLAGIYACGAVGAPFYVFLSLVGWPFLVAVVQTLRTRESARRSPGRSRVSSRGQGRSAVEQRVPLG